MATTFTYLLTACGLSQRQAAAFLHTKLATIQSWAQGRRNAPIWALNELAYLEEDITHAVEKRDLGLCPTAGHAAAAGRIAAKGIRLGRSQHEDAGAREPASRP